MGGVSMVWLYPSGYHAGTMRRATTTLALLLSGCPGPRDSAAPADCTRVDTTVGSIVHVCWDQPSEGTVNLHYRVAGEDWRPTLVAPLEAGQQELPLLGLPFGVSVEYRATLDGEPLCEGVIDTAPLPPTLPHIELLTADPEAWDPDSPWLLASIDHLNEAGTSAGTWVFITDRLGRIVWALETPAQRMSLHPRISADGAAILMDLNSHFGVFDRGAASQVQRLGIDGLVQQTWDTPGLHHPYTDLPDGSLAWGAWGEGLETLEVIDPSGAQRSLWDCAEYHAAQGMPGTNCSSNTLEHDAASDRFLFSFYTTHTVVEIDASNGETQRWFGQMPGSWGFEPADSAFVWQHGARYTEGGTLLASMRLDATSDETVVREYSLDSASETLREIWSFGEGQGLYAPELGEAVRLPGGNTLHSYGTGARIREVSPDGTVVWDLAFSPGSWLGRATPVENLYALWPM